MVKIEIFNTKKIRRFSGARNLENFLVSKSGDI